MFKYRDFVNKNSQGEHRLKQQAKMTSIGIYFFMLVMVVTFALALMR